MDVQTQHKLNAESQINNNFYCPHSEPLKRKVYKGSSSFERIKKNFDMELGKSFDVRLLVTPLRYE